MALREPDAIRARRLTITRPWQCWAMAALKDRIDLRGTKLIGGRRRVPGFEPGLIPQADALQTGAGRPSI